MFGFHARQQCGHSMSCHFKSFWEISLRAKKLRRREKAIDQAVRSHGRCDLTVADLRFDLADEVTDRVVGSELVQQPVVDHRPHPVHLLLLAPGRQLPRRAELGSVQLDLFPDPVEALIGQAAARGDGR